MLLQNQIHAGDLEELCLKALVRTRRRGGKDALGDEGTPLGMHGLVELSSQPHLDSGTQNRNPWRAELTGPPNLSFRLENPTGPCALSPAALRAPWRRGGSPSPPACAYSLGQGAALLQAGLPTHPPWHPGPLPPDHRGPAPGNGSRTVGEPPLLLSPVPEVGVLKSS